MDAQPHTSPGTLRVVGLLASPMMASLNRVPCFLIPPLPFWTSPLGRRFFEVAFELCVALNRASLHCACVGRKRSFFSAFNPKCLSIYPTHTKHSLLRGNIHFLQQTFFFPSGASQRVVNKRGRDDLCFLLACVWLFFCLSTHTTTHTILTTLHRSRPRQH